MVQIEKRPVSAFIHKIPVKLCDQSQREPGNRFQLWGSEHGATFNLWDTRHCIFHSEALCVFWKGDPSRKLRTVVIWPGDYNGLGCWGGSHIQGEWLKTVKLNIDNEERKKVLFWDHFLGGHDLLLCYPFKVVKLTHSFMFKIDASKSTEINVSLFLSLPLQASN